MDREEILGRWWLPQASESSLCGVLRLGTEKIELALSGTFPRKPVDAFLENVHVILGTCADGRKVTLLDCAESERDNILSIESNSAFHVHVALIGEHYNAREEVNFGRVSVGLKWLNELVGILRAQGEMGDNCFVRIYRQKQPSDIKLKDKNMQIGYRLKSSRNHSWMTVQQESTIHIIPQERSTLDNFLAEVRRLQDFLTFLANQPSFPTEVVGSADGEVAVSVKFTPIGRPATSKKLRPWMKQEDLEELFPVMLENWFAKDMLRPAIGLYCDVIYTYSFLEYRFFRLIQALETYHREKFRDSTGGEISLRERVIQCILCFSDVMGKKVIDEPDEYINAAVHCRNYLAHWDPERKQKCPAGISLYRLAETTKKLVAMGLLIELLPLEAASKYLHTVAKYPYFL